MIGTSSISQWITKGKKLGYIMKETDNKPVASVSVDQLQSARPVLVPQFSGKLTSARIWVDQFMVDHFIDLTYVHIMIRTIQ